MGTARVSNRLQSVQTPIIPVIGELVAAHPGTISLGQGVVSWGPPAEVKRAIDLFHSDPANHKYKLVDGLPELKEAIGGKLAAENGIALDERNAVVVTGGSNMAFMNAVLAIADPDDEIILNTPYYFNHEMAVTMAGCRPVLVPTDEQFQLQPERIKKAITQSTRAVVTISPNNPTGAVYPQSDLRAVKQLCRDAGIFHIHDEAYEYFTWDGAEHFSPGSIPESEDHTISLYSLSKAYGFASWRIGYMVLPSHLVEAVKKIQDTILICPPVISQVAAIAALKQGRFWCAPKIEQLGRVRGIVLDEAEKLKELADIPPASGAFYLLLKVKSHMPALELARRLVAEHGVAAIPGSAFHLEGCALRISYGALDEANAREGMRRLVEGLDKLIS